jgi:uncharacterized protein YndB with AHSA1/START domain
MTDKAAKITTPGNREIKIERVFDAPRDRVWRAFTDPKLVAQWWGRGNKLVIERMEVERGGRTKVVNTSLFHTTEERDGMLQSGMEQGLDQSYAALDQLLATLG